ncbi:MAG TPA: hypothetical protein VJA87_03680 [Candidatus Paceibacterota bacterium]
MLARYVPLFTDFLRQVGYAYRAFRILREDVFHNGSLFWIRYDNLSLHTVLYVLVSPRRTHRPVAIESLCFHSRKSSICLDVVLQLSHDSEHSLYRSSGGRVFNDFSCRL